MAEKSQVVENGVKFLGETVLPGTSLLLDGEFKAGLAHAVVGLLATAAIGSLGWILVAADSFSESVTGKSLIEQVSSSRPRSARA
jgi:hypothetical protein